ncbi:putative ATP-dependent zinc protease, partial [Brevirhabdus sp.]|uniref:putative ATP-dependent zinc protease n=1 Tax=Brevirhabdus sp. TaxID=2004514 RepID=UPI004058C2B6
MQDGPAPFNEKITLGWEEWVALPKLGLPALKAKVDTGARTSALHAFEIEPFGPAAKPKVRFSVHPVPGRSDLVIPCSAELIDRREVTSSNGESEWRYVISTMLNVGGRHWPIELTLTDRGSMAYRMLLGRQALSDEVVVSPNDSFCQPELNYEVYKSTQKLRKAAPNRALRIAVLSREDNYSTRRIVEEGERRGHVIEVIDTTRIYMAINALAPELHYDGARLPRFDAVIPRIGASITPYGCAVIRQFETLGTYCVNGSVGITASRDKLHAHQVLARHKIGMPTTAFAASPKDTDNLIGVVGTAPLIVKLLESTQGKGVVLAETKK